MQGKIAHTKKTLKQLIFEMFFFSIPFYLMDMILRVMAGNSGMYPIYYYSPIIYTVIWTGFFYFLITSCREAIGKILYWLFFVVSLAMFITNIIYFQLTGFFFSFSLVEMAGEGSGYIWDAVKNTPIFYYIIAFILLVLNMWIFKRFNFSHTQTHRFGWLFCVICFATVHLISPLMFGPTKTDLKWNSFNKPRSVYNSFSDYNKSMKLTGLYEYSVRDFYVSFLRQKEKVSKEDIEFLDSAYESGLQSHRDSYTGIFKDKNVIFLQLEGIDDWLLTKESMPNLYGLMKNSINFTDHYSIYSGGGSTFNSEFAVNTGFTTPISYNQNAYTMSGNTFPQTLPTLFKEQGYTVNAFHMNTGDFYSRKINYKSWGYDDYYSLLDTGDYKDNRYELDRELIENPDFYEKIFRKDRKFVDYIITYTPHTPFTATKGVGRTIAEEKYGKDSVPDLSEEESVKLMASETDKMVGLLIEGLQDNGLYDDTVIVAFSDHYLYTINDKSVLYKNQKEKNNLINHTPFFIWSSDVKATSVNKVTMQMNILPTILNLMGIDYNPSYYLCGNALSKDYPGLAFFSDYSWYDGNVYVENGTVKNGGKISSDELKAKNQYVNDIIKKNDLTLKADYFKTK